MALDPTGVTPDRSGLYKYDTKTRKVTKLDLGGFGALYTTHGLDAYVDRTDPTSPTVRLFIVNHRPPTTGDPKVVGADSVVELFETKLDSDSVRHLHTFRHEGIRTPNDVSADSPSSFYTTNGELRHLLELETDSAQTTAGRSTGYARRIFPNLQLMRAQMRKWMLLDQPESTVEYCKLVNGQTDCVTAAADVRSPNGITKVRLPLVTLA
jgi:hypothetical protein